MSRGRIRKMNGHVGRRIHWVGNEEQHQTVHVAELNQSQKSVLREEDHPGDREVRDIVSIFAVTRSARAKREREKEGERGRRGPRGGGGGQMKREEKQGNFRKETREIDSHRLRLCPRGFYDFVPRGKVTTTRNYPPFTRSSRGRDGKRWREREK